MQNVLPLEISFGGYVVILAKESRVLFLKEGFHLLRRPDIELPLLALAVGILRGIKAPLGGGHLPGHIIECLLRDPAVKAVAGDQVGVQVNPAQERVVIQHLLEVRYEPVLVNRIPMESSA